MAIFHRPETDKMVEFLDPETERKLLFLAPEIVKMVQQNLWAQKLSKCFRLWTQKQKVTITRPGNSENGSAIFLDPETDKMA